MALVERRLADETSRPVTSDRMLPTFVVIGAMKAGTTSLHHYLSLHPEISMSEPKELHFFSKDRNWNRGMDWYRRNFAAAKACGESSPSYTKFPGVPGVPERMHSLLPNAKLVYVVRDPIERLISHYVHRYARGVEHRSLASALDTFEENEYVDTSRYFLQLEQYRRYYDDSVILVLSAEQLKTARRETLQLIFGFLGVDDSFYTDEYEKLLGESAHRVRSTPGARSLLKLSNLVFPRALRRYIPASVPRPIQAYNARTSIRVQRPELDDALRDRLADYLADDVAKLRAWTGQELASWSI
jgi:hypothetical protein